MLRLLQTLFDILVLIETVGFLLTTLIEPLKDYRQRRPFFTWLGYVLYGVTLGAVSTVFLHPQKITYGIGLFVNLPLVSTLMGIASILVFSRERQPRSHSGNWFNFGLGVSFALFFWAARQVTYIIISGT